MRSTDLDWRIITNGWTREDLMYVRSILDEKIAQCDIPTLKRRIMICKED